MRIIKLPRWNDVLIEIYKRPDRLLYCEKLYKDVKCSRTQTREIVKLLNKYNLIEIIPTKKIKQLCLTEKGRKVGSALILIKAELR